MTTAKPQRAQAATAPPPSRDGRFKNARRMALHELRHASSAGAINDLHRGRLGQHGAHHQRTIALMHTEHAERVVMARRRQRLESGGAQHEKCGAQRITNRAAVRPRYFSRIR